MCVRLLVYGSINLIKLPTAWTHADVKPLSAKCANARANEQDQNAHINSIEFIFQNDAKKVLVSWIYFARHCCRWMFFFFFFFSLGKCIYWCITRARITVNKGNGRKRQRSSSATNICYFFVVVRSSTNTMNCLKGELKKKKNNKIGR